jgi:AcrR family transcriptional regulator
VTTPKAADTLPEKRARRRRPTDTRDRLLTAVDELLAERGWTACTLQAVARRAGLTTGAVYSTFGSRGALLAAAMLRRVDTAGSLSPDEPDLATAVVSYARTYYAITETPDGIQLVTTQLDLLRLAHTDAPLAEAVREGYEQLMERLVADLEARGAAVPGVTTVELAQRLVGVLQGLTLHKIAHLGDLTEQTFVDAALAAVGIARPT